MTARDQRRVAVPEGLDGERLDAALARMFGLSRTAAADLISGGQVLVAGRPAAKSDRVPAGEWLDVTLPAPPAPVPAPQAVPGLAVVYEDADIVVVDKPAGVAAHPTPGWSGPTVLGGLLATGHTIATSGAAERQGIVHRLDADTTGLMVLAKSECLLHAEAGVPGAHRGQGLHALVQGHPDPLRGTVDAPIAGTLRRRQVRGRGRGTAQRHPLRHAGGVPRRQPARHHPGDRPDPPDPGAHGGARHPAWSDRLYGRRPGPGRAPGCSGRQGRGPASASPTPRTGATWPSPATTPPTWPHALSILRRKADPAAPFRDRR